MFSCTAPPSYVLTWVVMRDSGKRTAQACQQPYRPVSKLAGKAPPRRQGRKPALGIQLAVAMDAGQPGVHTKHHTGHNQLPSASLCEYQGARENSL